ncbi:porin family protein [Taibaiella koreensis]|uniref:porin family protein n=1 Tax=Taibaiella koreensis TaxID=1268548 RepID=UPI000E5A053D|nr:porin family protein [Taibaiella koreensis]
MNKIVLLIFLTLLSTTTFAQIKFGPEAGYYMGMQSRKKIITASEKVTENSKPAPGASAGVVADLQLMKNMYLQGGVFYLFENIKYADHVDFTRFGLGSPSQTAYYRIHNFRVPVYLVYKSGFEGTGRFIAGAGPYVSYLFSGSWKADIPVVTYGTDPQKVSGYDYLHKSKDLQFGTDKTDDLKSWDYGAAAFLGYEANVGLYFKANFSYGLGNLSPLNTDVSRVRSWGMGISIGYLFGKDGW